MRRLHWSSWLVVGAMDCGGGDGELGDGVGSASETDDPSSGPISGPHESGSDGSESGSASTTADDSGTGDTTGNDTTEPATWTPVLQLSSHAVLEADDGGALVASCTVLHDGLPYDGDFTAELSVTPMRGVTLGEQITFDEFGTHEIGCAIEVEGEMLVVSTEIAVLDEAIDPVLAQLGEGLAGVEAGLFAVLDADMEDDAVL